MTQVTIIGAGPGGLASAVVLAGAGYEVEVLEKQPYVGGRTSSFTMDGFTFDLGPTFFSMPQILEEVFESSGLKMEDYVELIRLDPMYSLRFNGRNIRASSDEQKMFEETERHFPGSGASYQRFMQDTRKKLGILTPMLKHPHASLLDYVRLRSLRAVPELELGRSLYDVLSSYFEEEELKLSFTFQSKYLGMSPWDCPGAFTILSFMEHEYGIYHPKGGMNQLTKGLARAAEDLGAVIKTGCGVAKIHTENGKIASLVLEDGSRRRPDHTVMNADFAHGISTLIDDSSRKKYKDDRLAKKSYSLSTFMIYLGIEGSVDLDHHTVFFADDYKTNVEDISKRGVLSEDPSVYIQNASLTDESLAPEGDSALYILAPVPNNLSGINWAEETEAFRDLVLRQVETKAGITDLRSRIKTERVLTPQGWEEDIHIYKGATFNLTHHLSQMMYYRPHNQFEDVEGLWLTGGGTHPGSGLPTIFESAKITAGLIRKQDGKQVAT
ncbi:phytoene desaturase family protein [Alkalicoccus chagannorensis]|uniref:phytoene desaturase family protein n=1 Tax=Alkalicoccus chagannorensis TaxID=427072 RepID=UPI00040664AF|nr:phytoene desaturase family protein [Alkalicoccus chagannorensis]